MKKLHVILLALFFSQISIAQDTKSSKKSLVPDWKTLTDDYMTWYTYTYTTISLSQEFIGLDVDSVTIDKPTFLKNLLAGNVFAFKIMSIEGKDVYKLFPLTSKDEGIKAVVKEFASSEMRNYKREGTEMPAFSFTDINGINYDNSSTKGKLIVLKCWFIGCVACVEEFPELNKLVSNYKGNDSILFISLAIDKKDQLVKFLKTRKFKYAVVPEMKYFMNSQLNITHYPTHLLIDKTGKILKFVNRIEDLIPSLEKASK